MSKGEREIYCPCGGECHKGRYPCSFSCLSHHLKGGFGIEGRKYEWVNEARDCTGKVIVRYKTPIHWIDGKMVLGERRRVI